MNRIFMIVRVLLITLFFSSMVTGTASAGSTLFSPMQPPVRLQITIASYDQVRSIEGASPGTKLSSMLNLGRGLIIYVKKGGSAFGSFDVFSRISNGSYTTTGKFTFGGTYKNGKLSGTWVYNGNREGDTSGYNLGSQFYDASGDFVSTNAIEETGGKGVLSGDLIWTHTECDKQDTDLQSASYGTCLEKNIHTDTETFSVDWVATPLCGTATTVSCECKVQDSQARFNALTGTIEVNCDVDETDWEAAGMKMTLYVGDHIAARNDSSAILQFEDMNTYIMQPNTEIVLETPPEHETKLGLVMGRLWCNTKKLFLEGTMEIETSQAVLGIKGTTLVIETDGTTTTLKVIAGTVEFRSTTTGDMVIVATGQQASADDFGLLPVSTFDMQAELDSWASVADPVLLEPSDSVNFVEPADDGTPITEVDKQGIPGYVFYICGGISCIGIVVLVIIGVVFLLRRQKQHG